MNLRWVGAGRVVDLDEVVVALDLAGTAMSSDNRMFIGHARAHGLLTESAQTPKSVLITGRKVLLLPVSMSALRRRLMQT